MCDWASDQLRVLWARKFHPLKTSGVNSLTAWPYVMSFDVMSPSFQSSRELGVYVMSFDIMSVDDMTLQASESPMSGPYSSSFCFFIRHLKSTTPFAMTVHKNILPTASESGFFPSLFHVIWSGSHLIFIATYVWKTHALNCTDQRCLSTVLKNTWPACFVLYTS